MLRAWGSTLVITARPVATFCTTGSKIVPCDENHDSSVSLSSNYGSLCLRLPIEKHPETKNGPNEALSCVLFNSSLHSKISREKVLPIFTIGSDSHVKGEWGMSDHNCVLKEEAKHLLLRRQSMTYQTCSHSRASWGVCLSWFVDRNTYHISDT